jgi:hypothetical protein
MEESVRDAPEARPVNALVLYDPQVARTAKLRRAAGAARTALAVWGAVSLAGIGVVAALHGSGGLDAFARTSGAEVVAVADRSDRAAPPGQVATSEPEAATATAEPRSAETRASTPALRVALAAPAAAPVDAIEEAPAEPTVLARLPRSRPKSIVVADSVARRDPAQIRWRIRKLEDVPLRYAYTPYHAYAAPPPRRMPPPLLYEW